MKVNYLLNSPKLPLTIQKPQTVRKLRLRSVAVVLMLGASIIACDKATETAKVVEKVAKEAVVDEVLAAKEAVVEMVAAKKCGKITVANMNWQSAELLANVDKIILEKGFGCEVSLIAGDTLPTLTSMTEKGKPDVAPEFWSGSVKKVLAEAVDEKRLLIAGPSISDGGIEGLWIPKYLAEEYPDIKTIADAFSHPEIFVDPDDKEKGVLIGCPSGWACQATTANAFKAWQGKEKGFRLVDPGSAAGLDGSISKAYERKQPWLGYYWSPTSILGRYEMVKLEAGVPFDEEEWSRCNTKADCTDPQRVDWNKSKVVTVIVADFVKKHPTEVLDYFKSRSWDNATVNPLLAWMGKEQATGEDGALYFLRNNPKIWSAWVDSAIADKIQAGL